MPSLLVEANIKRLFSRGDRDDGNSKHSDENESLANELIESGGAFAGAATGAAVGAAGGPVGILVGAAAGVAIERTVVEVGAAIRRRVLEPREEARAGTALGVAIERIAEKVQHGERLRSDAEFFESEKGRTPQAEQLLEATLRAAMDSFEEAKVPFIGELYANLAFRGDLGPAYAHSLVRIVNQLSWRQLCLVAYLGSDLDDVLALVEAEKPPREPGPRDAIWIEVQELSRLGLLGVAQEFGKVVAIESVWLDESGPSGLKSKLALTAIGRDLYDLANLKEIARGDVLQVHADL